MNILVIGGTGIIGRALLRLAASTGANVVAISRDAQTAGGAQDNVRFVTADRKDRARFAEIARVLQREYGGWDLLVDVIAFGEGDVSQVRECFGACVGHFVLISTTLVYARGPCEPSIFSADQPLAAGDQLGGYVARKVEVESAWRRCTRGNWTILRPYHVLGPGALPGCLPFHNRDVNLVRRLLSHEPLVLCRGGEVDGSFIHPDDLAEIILRLAQNERSFGRAFNAVYPVSFRAFDYYRELAGLLRAPLFVEAASYRSVWERGIGWELTALSHRYDAADLYAVASFVPLRDLRQCLVDALATQPEAGRVEQPGGVHERIALPPAPMPMPWLSEQDADEG